MATQQHSPPPTEAPFTVLGMLGQGGFSRVLKVKDNRAETLGRILAWKVVCLVVWWSKGFQ